jgi:hypothetical protein
MWAHYDSEGILPPRTCEMDEARNSGRTLDAVLAEMLRDVPKEEWWG